MVLPRGNGDLYHKYRPQRFDELCGHKAVIKSLKNAISSSHPSQAFILLGESGTGKTSSARIMALSLNCTNRGDDLEPCLECPPCKMILTGECVDVIERNAADHRGIDAVRELSSTMSLCPMQVNNKVYILDEFHQMTKDAQTSLLKVLEEAPKRTFIILCTTDAGKILPTVKNRCQVFTFKSLSTKELFSLLENVCAYEGETVSPEVLNTIAEYSAGSPRSALVKLQQVIQMGPSSKEEVSNLLEGEEYGGDDFFKFLNSINRNTPWSYLMNMYSEIKGMGAPAIGMSLAGWYKNKLIKAAAAPDQKLYAGLLELFVVPFEESKLGENKLILNLFKALDTYKKTSYVSK